MIDQLSGFPSLSKLSVHDILASFPLPSEDILHLKELELWDPRDAFSKMKRQSDWLLPKCHENLTSPTVSACLVDVDEFSDMEWSHLKTFMFVKFLIR